MKRCMFSGFTLILCMSFLVTVGCKKKPQPLAQPPAGPSAGTSTSTGRPGLAPTIDLSASPTTIGRGEEATLTWDSSNADSVVIDGGVGNVARSGSVRVAPLESTTYTATATADARQARSSARITVTRGGPQGDLVASDIEGLQRAIDEGLVKPVFFAYDSAELSPEARTTLEENARWFRQFPDADLIVEGHCDERGTEEYNLALGDQRAQTTRDHLIQLGIPGSRMDAISFGEERPFVQGHTEAAWAKNRRAHFVVR